MAATGADAQPCQQAATDGAGQGEQAGFGEQVGHDAQPATAECRPKRHLPLTRRRAGEQHVGDVAAGDEQQQDDRAEQREQHVAEAADDAVAQVEHLDPHLRRVLVGVRRGRAV